MDSSKWTSFNSGKLFSQIYRWNRIEPFGFVPPPVMLTVDMANVCNLACEWCNASKVRENKRMLSKTVLFDFADFLTSWERDGFKVETICLAGGGEPLCNPHAGEFMLKLTENNIKFATVTNGVLINRYMHEMLNSQYVAVSVDAGTAKTFNKYKGLSADADTFDRIIDNMADLCELLAKI